MAALQQTSYLARSLVQHGEDGVAVRLPAEVRDDQDVTISDSVDLDYDRETNALTIHFPDQSR